MKWSDDVVHNDHHLCRFTCQIMILAHMQATVLVFFQGTAPMKIEMHCNIVGCKFSLSGRGLMQILPGKSFQEYNVNLMAKQVTLTKFMIVAIASNAPTCIVDTCDYESPSLDTRQENTKQGNKNEDEYSINAVHYESPERRDEQVDWHNAVWSLDENLNIEWKMELMILNEYSAYHDQSIHILTQFESIWDGHLGSLKRCSPKLNLIRWIANLYI